MIKKGTPEELEAYRARRQAEFDALPLIEQIRLVVREEINAAECLRQAQERERQQYPFGRPVSEILNEDILRQMGYSAAVRQHAGV